MDRYSGEKWEGENKNNNKNKNTNKNTIFSFSEILTRQTDESGCVSNSCCCSWSSSISVLMSSISRKSFFVFKKYQIKIKNPLQKKYKINLTKKKKRKKKKRLRLFS